MSAQIIKLYEVTQEAIDLETICGENPDWMLLEACARLRYSKDRLTRDRAIALECAIVREEIARRSWRVRFNLDRLVFWFGVVFLLITLGLSIAKGWQNFWLVTEWSQGQ